jgi:hypothetical protein
MKEEIADNTWTTADECVYLQTIGQYKFYSFVLSEEEQARERIRLLKCYIKACHKRVKWDVMNRSVVIEFAKQELIRLMST